MVLGECLVSSAKPPRYMRWMSYLPAIGDPASLCIQRTASRQMQKTELKAPKLKQHQEALSLISNLLLACTSSPDIHGRSAYNPRLPAPRLHQPKPWREFNLTFGFSSHGTCFFYVNQLSPFPLSRIFPRAHNSSSFAAEDVDGF